MKAANNALLVFALFLLGSCNLDSSNQEYGVFLSVDNTQMQKLDNYHQVVIDAQYFEKEDIATLHANNQLVYSYLNIGSLEDFRDYYSDYKDLVLGEYENWDEEYWIDVTNVKWQKFMENLASSLIEKGIDGFFVDNTDVYYVYQETDIFLGVRDILLNLMKYNKKVIINGGDTFMYAYRKNYNNIKEIATGVNQESVFSCIDFDHNKLTVADDEDRQYFMDYVEMCSRNGLDVYLLEYTTSQSLIKKIDAYCKEKGFSYYISDSIELD